MSEGHPRKVELGGLGFLLAVGLVVSTVIASRTVERVKRSNQTVTVKGYAEKKITSDLGIWSAGLTARGVELVEAYAKIERDLERVLTYLESSGVVRDAVNVSSVYTDIKYKLSDKGQRTNEIEGYVLSQSVEIRSTDIALVTKLAKESTHLIREGLEIRSGSPQYIYTRLDDLKIEMLGQAAADARARAETLVAGSGGTLGALRRAQQGVFQITPAHSTEVSDYGRNDTSSVEKAIKAVVTFEYSVK